MTSADVGLGFWLQYVQASGGLTESTGDSTLVMLPAALQTMLELPEELQVTADPDVAREDNVTLLSAGHPALSRSADEVLAMGDVAALAVEANVTPPPSAEYLQALARDQFVVDHGRIDAAGAPTRSVRPVLLIGALVDYTLSSDDRYQECAECWVDVASRRQLPTDVSAKLAALTTAPIAGPPTLTGLIDAIGLADRMIEQSAERRRAELGEDTNKARDAELDRVEAYYRDALTTIERRCEQAPADRRELLDARANSVRTERARRMAETREKYQASHHVRPYRLHVYEVPVWRLPVDVRRGDRRYPLTLDWLIPLSRFSEIACPHCGADERLVATKTRVGCSGCVPRPTARLAPEPTRPPARLAPEPTRPPPKSAAKAKPVANRPPTPKKRPSSVRTDPGTTPAKLAKLGDKLTGRMWDAVAQRDRRLARMCTPDSPAAAAIRLYGPSGVAWAVGIHATDDPVAIATCTTAASPDPRQATIGYVDTAAGYRLPFLIRWQTSGSVAQIDEILPYDEQVESAHLSRRILGPGRTGVHAPPQPRITLGTVGEQLWQRVIPQFGLPSVLRCLAALWRLPDENAFAESHGPMAVAAGIERLVCQRANLTTGRFADIADTYHVEEAAVRAAVADLGKCLQLSADRPW